MNVVWSKLGPLLPRSSRLKDFTSLTTRKLHLNKLKNYKPFGFVAVFVAIGVIALVVTKAATPTTQLEPELGSLSGAASVFANANASGGSAVSFGGNVWKPLKLGAGGWLTGMDMSADGQTKVVRTDTYGAYIWNGNSWSQLVTSSSMPSDDVLPYSGFGVYEIQAAPNNDNKLYMAFRGSVYRSADKGLHWTKTSLTGKPYQGGVGMDANAQSLVMRVRPHKMAVDPANDNVVYQGVPGDGVYKTTDGGVSWSKVSGLPTPAADTQGYTGILFDPSSGTVSGKTKTIYIHAKGYGYYKSTDAGSSWALISGSSTDLHSAAMASDGTLYFGDTDNGNLVSHVYKYKNNVLRTIFTTDNSPGSVNNSPVWSIAVDPNTSQHIVIANDGGTLNSSYNGGTSWEGFIGRNAPYKSPSSLRHATDVPWLAWTNENYMSNGNMMFDPGDPGTLWFDEGIGVWTTTPTANMSQVTWDSHSAGIEQLVVNDILSSPDGSLNVAVWDRGSFRITDPDTYPTQHQPSNLFNDSWDMDYSVSSPSFLVSNYGTNNTTQGTPFDPGYSQDGGQHWTTFATMPQNSTSAFTYGFGNMAVGDNNHVVWVSAGNKWPYYTANRGASWQQISMQGLNPSTANLNGFIGYYASNNGRHILASDKATANTFYMYYYLPVSGSPGTCPSPCGIYKSTDGGANWTRVFSPPANNTSVGSTFYWASANSQLEAVPGEAGHLFFTAGESGSWPDSLTHTSTPEPLLYSTNGGSTWNSLDNVQEVYHFGFGKAMPGSSHPTLFIAGWVNNQYGIWRSKDEGITWTNLGDFPMGNMDAIQTISGDMNIAGRVYVGFYGSGAAYRDSQ